MLSFERKNCRTPASGFLIRPTPHPLGGRAGPVDGGLTHKPPRAILSVSGRGSGPTGRGQCPRRALSQGDRVSRATAPAVAFTLSNEDTIMAKAKFATKSHDVDNLTVTFHFSHGPELVCDVTKLPERMLQMLALHGVKQKVGDAYGSSGKVFTAEQAYETAKALWDRLLAGTWREAGGSGLVIPDQFYLEAIATLKGLAADKVQAIWDNLDDEQRKGVKADPEAKAKAMALYAEARAAEAPASDALSIFD